MLELIWDAVRARRVSSLALGLLAALAMAAIAWAPGYSAAAARDSAAALVREATPAQRTLSVQGRVTSGGDDRPAVAAAALQRFRDSVGLELPAERVAVGLRRSGTLFLGTRQVAGDLRYRDDFCEAVLVTGRCPAARGEVVVSEQLPLGVTVGDRARYAVGPGTDPLALTVVGTYRARDPIDWYWSGQGGTALYGTAETVLAGSGFADARLDALLPAGLFADPGRMDATLDRLHRQQFAYSSGAAELYTHLADDGRAVRRGVQLATAELLVVALLAFTVTARYAAEARRFDVARMALHGTARSRMLILVAGEGALPLLAGIALGGFAWRYPPLAVGSVAAGGLGAIIIADWRTISTPVQRLLQSGTPHGSPRGGATLDIAALALAGAAVFQAVSLHGRPDAGFGLEAFVPVLLALATAVLLSRLLLPLAARAGHAAAVTSDSDSRLGTGIGVLLLARRGAVHRLVPLLAAGSCLFAVAVQDWVAADEARADRATIAVGAERVLTVDTGDQERLLAAVRAADQTGTRAMAVVQSVGPDGRPVLAVDSARLAAVAGISPAAAARLHPPAPAPLTVTGTALRLDATADAPGVSVVVGLVAAGTGEKVTAVFPAGTSTVDVPQCRRGCRMTTVELAGVRTTVTIRQLSADGAVAVPGGVFGDPARWRTSLGDTVPSVSPTHPDGALVLTALPPGKAASTDPKVYVVDTPVPLPALVTGRFVAVGDEHNLATVRPFGEAVVPISPSPYAVLPRVGADGTIVDLEYAARLAGTAVPGDRQQVWLAPHAPQSIVDDLRAAGLRVVAEDSTAAAHRRLDGYGPAAALRYGLLAGALALLLAAGAFGVAGATQRPDTDAQLLALRVQGAPARVVRAAGFVAATAPAVAAVLIGLLSAVVARLLAAAPVDPFADGWSVLPPPTGPAAVPLAAGAAAAALCFAAVALLTARTKV
ncbi:hypothetical protein GCM10022255_075140 [Dactylosporangium darangshiense]|uniref:FtsX-like permease family protein n=1 Tax=Dactylosporangium darangshiense TaxID=579108 RepID=A0ABP8DJH9_9ACTN